MSKAALDAFRASIKDDEGLRREMAGALASADIKSDASVRQLVDFARARGFDFSVDDVRQTVELSDDQLDAVAGGAAYLKLDGVDGEVRAKGHKEWIDVLSVQF